MSKGKYAVVDQATGLVWWFHRLDEATEYARALVDLEKQASKGRRNFQAIVIARCCYQVGEEGELEEVGR